MWPTTWRGEGKGPSRLPCNISFNTWRPTTPQAWAEHLQGRRSGEVDIGSTLTATADMARSRWWRWERPIGAEKALEEAIRR